MTEFRILGALEWRTHGLTVGLGPPKQRTVLAALLIHAGQSVSLDALATCLWDDTPPAEARSVLYAHLARIRRTLAIPGDGAVQLERRCGGYAIDLDPALVDIHRFQTLVDLARAATRDEQRADLLGEALRLWQGPALADLPGPWAARVRQAWALRHLDAATCWANAEMALGNASTVVSKLSELLDEYPLAESLAAVFLRALHASCRSVEALTYYAALRRRMVDQLGIDPGSELRQVHQSILRGELMATAGGAGARPARPAQLPPDIQGFTGRAVELARLDAALAASGRATSTAATVLVLSGTAGVGKTALAVHWAHRVADRFTDGQLFVDLHGYDAEKAPLRPGAAARSFLRALGVPRHQMPAGTEAQIGLYRSLLAGRRAILVLDNAHDSAQVRPLLPGSAECLAVVTSRNQLFGLLAAEGAQPVALDLPAASEARTMLLNRLGPNHADADPAAVDAIVGECGRLPLALSIIAAGAVARPGMHLATLARQLRDSRDTLGTFSDLDPATDIRTVFAASYRELSIGAARVFRFLGTRPQLDITAATVTQLCGLSCAHARTALAELVRANLIAESSADGFTCHRLLHAYAAELAGTGGELGYRAVRTVGMGPARRRSMPITWRRQITGRF